MAEREDDVNRRRQDEDTYQDVKLAGEEALRDAQRVQHGAKDVQRAHDAQLAEQPKEKLHDTTRPQQPTSITHP